MEEFKFSIPVEPKESDYDQGKIPLNDMLDYKLKLQRYEWANKMIEVIQKIDRVSTIPEAQIYMLSYRHVMTDEIASIQSQISHMKERNYITKRLQYQKYDKLNKENGYNPFEEKKIHLDADLSEKTRRVEMLETQVSFFKDTVKTLDQLGFSIKNRIQLNFDL